MTVSGRFAELVARLRAETAAPGIALEATPAAALPATASSFFGTPYLPEGQDQPWDSHGDPLAFLAQIRFDELPPIGVFPTAGLAQFWIGTDDLLGRTADGLTAGDFCVRYFPVVEQRSEMGPYLAPDFDHGERFSPYYGDDCFALSFTPITQPLSIHDYRFDPLLSRLHAQLIGGKEVSGLWDLTEVERYYLFDSLDASGHRMGGYPVFNQSDPRSADDDLDTLLLQIDSVADIMWGDLGVGHFFINSERLAAADFSRVGYTWDCR